MPDHSAAATPEPHRRQAEAPDFLGWAPDPPSLWDEPATEPSAPVGTPGPAPGPVAREPERQAAPAHSASDPAEQPARSRARGRQVAAPMLGAVFYAAITFAVITVMLAAQAGDPHGLGPVLPLVAGLVTVLLAGAAWRARR